MEVSLTKLDALNAELTIKVSKADYAEKVDSVLKGYRKKANIPGFRKGQVPMGLIKKQYEKNRCGRRDKHALAKPIKHLFERDRIGFFSYSFVQDF